MAKSIDELTEIELKNFIKSYERENKLEGGKFSLSQLLVEKLRRSPSAVPPHEVVRYIVQESSRDPSGTITYGKVWELLKPNQPWQGNHSIKVVGGSLGAAIAYCVRNNLPLVSTLVVQTGTGKLASRAIKNIYDEAKLYGRNVGLVPEDFVKHEAEQARRIKIADLPAS